MFCNFNEKIYALSERYGRKWNIDLKYFVKNGLWTLIKQLFGGVSGLILSIAFARLSTKEIFGQYQLIISILSVVSVISIPGLNIAVARSAARGNDGDYKKSVKTSFLWSLFGIPILLMVGLYYYYFDSKIMGLALMISSVFFPLFYAPNTWGGFLTGKSRFDIYTKFSSILAIVNAGVTTLVIFLDSNNLIAIVVSYLSSFTILNVLYYWKSLRLVKNNFQDKETIKYGWFLTLTYNIETVADSINNLIIGIFLSPVHLAIYSVISLLPMRLRNVVKPFFHIAFPKMASGKINIPNMVKKNRQLLYYCTACLLIMGLIYYFLIERVCTIFFGKNYIEYYALAKYFTIFVIISFPLIFLNKYVQANKMNRTILFTGPVFLFFRALLTVIFVYQWHLLGAVLAFNISSLIRLIVAAYSIKLEEKNIGLASKIN